MDTSNISNRLDTPVSVREALLVLNKCPYTFKVVNWDNEAPADSQYVYTYATIDTPFGSELFQFRYDAFGVQVWVNDEFWADLSQIWYEIYLREVIKQNEKRRASSETTEIKTQSSERSCECCEEEHY